MPIYQIVWFDSNGNLEDFETIQRSSFDSVMSWAGFRIAKGRAPKDATGFHLSYRDTKFIRTIYELPGDGKWTRAEPRDLELALNMKRGQKCFVPELREALSLDFRATPGLEIRMAEYREQIRRATQGEN
jgi:hypothetical protein